MSKTPVLERPDKNAVTSTRVPTGGYQAVGNTATSAETPPGPAPATPQQPAPDSYSTENLGFDIGKTSGNAIDDMTGLLDSGSDYMKRAESRGMQYANDRGLLNSTMGGEAAQAAAMDAALPLVQTQSSERAASRGLATDIYGQEDSQLHDFAVQDREFQQSERMLNLETSSKESLIALEQEYNLLMTNNENMSKAWSDITTGISDIFRAGLTLEETEQALNYMLGPEVDGVRSGGMAEATLNYQDAISGGASSGGGFGVSGSGVQSMPAVESGSNTQHAVTVGAQPPPEGTIPSGSTNPAHYTPKQLEQLDALGFDVSGEEITRASGEPIDSKYVTWMDNIRNR